MIARSVGCVVRTRGETLLAALPGACVGDGVRIVAASGARLAGEVAAVKRGRIAIVPFGSLCGIAVGDRVEIAPGAFAFPFGFSALGRALDAAGEPLDGKVSLRRASAARSRPSAPPPFDRRPIRAAFWTGMRVLDGLVTIGRGARIGIFGGPGAGKTTLLEMITRGARADAIVLALVGERGREARMWFERLDARTSIVCATSDRSAAERVRAADVAMSQAQNLRARGLHVLLVVDSLARYVAALREARVALGEPLGRGGYPPSVWGDLARYVERAGNAACGSITLLATVLSDGGDEREPLSDAARSLLDGHVVLSGTLARAGHFPAIDVVESTSRTMLEVTGAEHARAAGSVRAALALLAETKDARALGLSSPNAALNAAVAAEEALAAFLRQREPVEATDTLGALQTVALLLERAT